jgi:hypothetical protein
MLFDVLCPMEFVAVTVKVWGKMTVYAATENVILDPLDDVTVTPATCVYVHVMLPPPDCVTVNVFEVVVSSSWSVACRAG